MNWDNLNRLNVRRLKLAKQWLSTGTHHWQLRTAAGRRDTHEGLCTTHTRKYHKVKEKDKSIRDTQHILQRSRGHIKAACSWFRCLGALWPTNSCLQEPHKTHTNRYKWHKADKAGWTWGQVSAWMPSYPCQFYPTLPTGFARLANRVSDLPWL